MKRKQMFLIGAAATLLSLSSCKQETKKEDAKKQDTEAIARQQRAEDSKFFEEKIQELYAKYGYDKEKDYAARAAADSIKGKIAAVDERKCHQLNREVGDNLDKISSKYAQKIEKMFTENYKLYLNDGVKKDLQELCRYTYGNAFPYPDAEDQSFKINSYELDSFFEKVDMGSYGEMRQKEIKDKTEQLLLIMCNEQDTRRLAIAKTYAEYYPILDKSKIPAEYVKDVAYDPYAWESEGGLELEYNEWMAQRDTTGHPTFEIYRKVSVYDSKLPVDFFHEEGAAYKLNQVGEGKWQVERKGKDGKITKTPVFNDNVEYKIVLGGYGNEFDATPGANMGVRVSVSEKLFEIKCKDDKLHTDAEAAALKKPLQKELEKYEAIIAKYDGIRERAWNEADSLLKQRKEQREAGTQMAAFKLQKGGMEK